MHGSRAEPHRTRHPTMIQRRTMAYWSAEIPIGNRFIQVSEVQTTRWTPALPLALAVQVFRKFYSSRPATFFYSFLCSSPTELSNSDGTTSDLRNEIVTSIDLNHKLESINVCCRHVECVVRSHLFPRFIHEQPCRTKPVFQPLTCNRHSFVASFSSLDASQ